MILEPANFNQANNDGISLLFNMFKPGYKVKTQLTLHFSMIHAKISRLARLIAV
jgi:hypothetical protein